MPEKPQIKCEQEGCEDTNTILCHLHDYEQDKELTWHYCPKHAEENGFCVSCGDFWGGIESFEFVHPGLCDNCHSDIQAELAEFEDEDIPDYFDDGDDYDAR